MARAPAFLSDVESPVSREVAKAAIVDGVVLRSGGGSLDMDGWVGTWPGLYDWDTVVVGAARLQKPFKPFQMAVRTAIIWSPMARNAVARVIVALASKP